MSLIFGILIIGLIATILLFDRHITCLHESIKKILIVGYLITVLFITVCRKVSFITPQKILVPFQSYRVLLSVKWHGYGIYVAMAILGNLILFVPLGIIIAKVMWRKNNIGVTIAIGFLCSLMIETYQYFSCVGTFEIDDLIQNTWGAWIGCCLQNIVEEWQKNGWNKTITIKRNMYPIIFFGMMFGTCCLISMLR